MKGIYFCTCIRHGKNNYMLKIIEEKIKKGESIMIIKRIKGGLKWYIVYSIKK